MLKRCSTALFALWSAGMLAGADGGVTGYGRYPKLIDRPALGYVQMYEWNLFLLPLGGTIVGPSRRLGAPPGLPPTHDGYYQITTPAGAYSIYVNQPLFFGRPAVVPDCAVTAGATTARLIAPPMDFTCNFTDTWALPWGNAWYQTFVARGTSITGVSFRLAGTNAEEVEVSILAADETRPPAQWMKVSAAAERRAPAKTLADNWVKWRSNLVPVTPGRAYAVKLRGTRGGDLKFSPFNRLKDALSYPGGKAYDAAGAAQNYDLNVTVFSDSDGTVITYIKTTSELGELIDGYYAARWGQTFKAIGSSLAAVDVWAAGADSRWDLDFTFTVREDGPTGARIGPAKTTKAAYQAFGAGLHAASYHRGEVSLTPGRTYYVEFTNPAGFNPYIMRNPQDAYPDGTGYQNGSLRNDDVSMTIVEYAPGGGEIAGTVRNPRGDPVPGAAIALTPGAYAAVTDSGGAFTLAGIAEGVYTVSVAAFGFEPHTRTGVFVGEGALVELDFVLTALPCATPFQNGSLENGLTGWTPYGGARTTVESGPWFADIVAADGAFFHGNAIHGGTLPPGGLYQRFCVEPGHRYRAAAASNLYWIGGTSQAVLNRVGLDPSGGTSAVSGSVVWSAWDRQPREATAGWRTITVEAEAAGNFMTLLLDFRQTAEAGLQWRINCFDAAAVTDLTPPVPRFTRGDCNGDRKVDVGDAVCILGYLFAQSAATCLDALDAQDDGKPDIADAVYLLRFLFASGPPPPPPGLECGPDPTGDGLGCEAYDCGGHGTHGEYRAR